MESYKTFVDSKLDLGLYLENLFAEPTPEVKPEELIETEHLQSLLDAELEERLETDELIDDIQIEIPDWAQQSFRCLLVKLAGMRLLVPAMSIAYVERVNKKITRIPLDKEAFKGVITLRNNSTSIIDLFSLIAENAPGDNEQLACVDRHHIDYVMVMEKGNYALACDDVDEMVTLTQDDVRWNKSSFNNPMFTGVVTDFLCPLLNIDHLYQQVEDMPFVQSLNERSE